MAVGLNTQTDKVKTSVDVPLSKALNPNFPEVHYSG
jgi:hypothetical protein